MATLLSVQGLTKVFQGFTAIEDLSFDAEAGEIFGLLGPNGAGKTTTIRVAATVLAPTAGTVVVGGHDVREHPERARAALGVLTADIGLYDRFTAWENLRYFGQLYGMPKDALEQRIEDLVRELEMERFADRRAGKFSTGMKQKVAIGRSVIHDPAVVIFDEPTAGLDVLASQTVVAMMRRFRAQGKLVVLSTHDMHAAGQLCDRVAVLHRGRLVTTGTVEDIRARTKTDSLEAAFLATIGADEARATLQAAESRQLEKLK